MLFNSLHFLAFFPVVVAVYFLTPARIRWLPLLAASCYFYMAFVPKYILVLFFLIAVDYSAGLLIERAVGHRRKVLLIASIIANVGTLAVFKYTNFALENTSRILQHLDISFSVPALAIALPIGLSFHTFQSMSYTIEVYRGRQAAEHHLGRYALYVLFFPQLVAGPIERPQHLLPQFTKAHAFDIQRIIAGLQLMLWGFFQKVAIADRLAVVVGGVYSHPRDYQGPALLLATYFFAFQIYCDFSGYTDIARGAAQVLGFDLVSNFERPYFSKSIAEFWRRWHISLSSWFRDYLYLPLGGNRVGRLRWVRNILVVFLLSGLWHGANWTFVVWGLLHGTFIIIGAQTRAFRDRLFAWCPPRVRRVLAVIVTFNLVAFAWIFFRANSLGDALYIATHLLTSWPTPSLLHRLPDAKIGVELSILLIGVLLWTHWIERQKEWRAVLAGRGVLVRWTSYYALIVGLLLLGMFRDPAQFIYFQF